MTVVLYDDEGGTRKGMVWETQVTYNKAASKQASNDVRHKHPARGWQGKRVMISVTTTTYNYLDSFAFFTLCFYSNGHFFNG
jgi:hypothetical protein